LFSRLHRAESASITGQHLTFISTQRDGLAEDNRRKARGTLLMSGAGAALAWS
jgi:hypothetical protein